MRVLVAGCGSIGRRHIRNLLNNADISEILVYTRSMECRKGVLETGRVRFVENLNSLPQDISFAIIANRTHEHLDAARLLAGKGLHLFIEKPVAPGPDGIEALSQMIRRSGLKAFVAYNLRFLGVVREVKRLLDDGAIGRPCFARIEVGQYLPQWRPGTDYRNSYSAKRGEGGGVALDLSHEIDYMRYLFGDPAAWKTFSAKTSSLEIDSDDVFEGIYDFGGFIANVHLDYLQTTKRRRMTIVGSGGSIDCDLAGKTLAVDRHGDRKVYGDPDLFDVERTYVDELSHFISVVKGQSEPEITLSDGLAALMLIEDGSVR